MARVGSSFSLAEKLSDLSRSSVRLVYAVLRLMLASAVDDGVLLANPADGLGRTLRLHPRAGARQDEIGAMQGQPGPYR